MKKLTFLLLIFISNLTYSQLNIDHYIGVGETLVQIGNYVGAIENFNIVIRFKPHLPEPYYFRAVAKHQLEDYRGAIQDYNTAINIKPYFGKELKALFGNIYPENQLIHVLLHEIAHSVCDEIGHTDKFNQILDIFLIEAEKNGLYDPKIPPIVNYCQYSDE